MNIFDSFGQQRKSSQQFSNILMSTFSIECKKAGNVAPSTPWRHLRGVEVHMTPLILILGTGRTWVVNNTPGRFTARRKLCYVLNRRLGGHRSWCGRFGWEKLESFYREVLWYIKWNFKKKKKSMLIWYVPTHLNYFLRLFVVSRPPFNFALNTTTFSNLALYLRTICSLLVCNFVFEGLSFLWIFNDKVIYLYSGSVGF